MAFWSAAKRQNINTAVPAKEKQQKIKILSLTEPQNSREQQAKTSSENEFNVCKHENFCAHVHSLLNEDVSGKDRTVGYLNLIKAFGTYLTQRTFHPVSDFHLYQHEFWYKFPEPEQEANMREKPRISCMKANSQAILPLADKD